MKSYKIHFIRHGRTEANEKGLYIGKTDLPLSPEGLGRLLQLKKEREYPPAARYFTSPLSRCRQTLEVLYPGCRQEVADGLAECDFGEWDGRSIAQLKTNTQFQRWMAGEKVDVPGGEDAAVFQQRVTKAFEGLVSQLMMAGDTDAVICTHGGVIMLLIPGAALTNAVRDMLVGHTISGLLRLAESLLLALMLAIGFGSAIYLFGA